MSDEPINFLSRRLSKFFTNTDSTTFDYQRGREREILEKTYYTSEQKVFKCKCISHRQHNTPSLVGHFFDSFKISDDSVKKAKIKIWFIEDDEFMNGPNPNPESTDNEQLINLYTKNAREAIITSLYSNISYGDILSVERRGDDYYVIEHHLDEKPIFSSFIPSGDSISNYYSQNKNKIKKINSYEVFPCIEKSQQTPGSCYQKGPYTIKNHGGKLNTSLTFFEFSHLSKYMDIVLNYISRYESGGDGYNANNIGNAGVSVDLQKVLGKNLTDMSVEEVRGNMNDNSGILFATGKYQIIPRTLDIIYRSFYTVKFLPYNEINQDAMGTFLATVKRKRLGKYLLLGEGSPQIAGNDLALEWAFSPFLQGEKIGKKFVNVGQSPYEGIAGNKTNPKRVKEAYNVLVSQRQKIKNAISSDVFLKTIIEKYKGDVSG